MRQRDDIAALVKNKTWRADTARRIVDAFEESGLRARAFSELYGFNEKRISAWKLRFGLRARGRPRRCTAVNQAPKKNGPPSHVGAVRMVAVRVRGEEEREPPVAEATHVIEVQTPGGCVLRVPSAFDERAVGRMLRLLGGSGC